MDVLVQEMQRKDFGRCCYFEDTPARLVGSFPDETPEESKFVTEVPRLLAIDTTPELSQHVAQTAAVKVVQTSMQHVEGGWPKDVDYTEKQDVARYRKRQQKDENFKTSVVSLGSLVEKPIMQNNTIDLYETYFEGEVKEHSSEPPSAKGVAVFRDPRYEVDVARTVTSINWHPDSAKIAASYSIMDFQHPSHSLISKDSFIWDVNNPNTPEHTLTPPSPLCCLRFNPKTTDTLVGGSYNGLISFYDIRKSQLPIETSVIENSHHDAVYDVHWVSSKTGNLCVSTSTDGQMLWWDTRRLSEPMDKLQLNTGGNDGIVMGATSLEYNSEAGPTKYLVGTEQGCVMNVNLRNKKQNNGVSCFDRVSGKHHAPVYSIQRNPIHPKVFLTVGDWTARIWNEDLKTPIMMTKYHSAYTTAACWSPTRAGVFYVTRADGVVDVWDYFYRQNDVAYSHKVGDTELSSIAVQPSSSHGAGGRSVAVGDKMGTISLLEVCESLAVPQSNEKLAIGGMFDREAKREKNLELRAKEMAKRQAALERKAKEANSVETEKEQQIAMDTLLRKMDVEFMEVLNKADGDDRD